MKQVLIYFSICLFFMVILVDSSFSRERFIMRSFTGWEDSMAELNPVFRQLRNPFPNWEKVHELAYNLSLEASDSSIKAQMGNYFVILSERALKENFTKPDLSEKLQKIQKIQDFIQHQSPALSDAMIEDIVFTLTFETACTTYWVGEDEKAIKILTDLLKDHPGAMIAPDAARRFAELILERKDYNRGISFLERLARKSDDYPALRFEAFYQCSILETQVIQKSPKALWYCHQAVESVTEPDLQKRARDRLDILRELQKQEL